MMKHAALLLMSLCLQVQGAQAQPGNTPRDGAYPGRCPERIGRSVPGESFFMFTCDSEVDGFALNNDGPNAIVPNRAAELDLFPRRNFYFNFPGRHRQEMHLLLADWPSDVASDVRISKLYFFPRVVVPSIRKVDAKTYAVILPNADKVLFKASTLEVAAGSFTETPLDRAAYARNPQLFAGIQYHSALPGTTVMVRIDRRGPASFHAGEADVTRQCQGVVCGTCRVPTKEILRDETTEFRFADDASFSRYLKSKCGFDF